MNIKMQNMHELAEYRNYLRTHPKLRYLFLELTDRCNMSCLHCGSACSTKKETVLPKEDIFSLLDRLADHYKTEDIMVCLTGGEPLLHPDFFEIAEYIHRKGFSWGMTTNGTLINEFTVKKLADAGMGSVSVSLDGLEENHNWLRGSSGAFRHTIKGIRALQNCESLFAAIQVTTVIHRNNIDEMEEIYSFLKKEGVKQWRLTNIEPIGRALKHKELLLKPSEYQKMFEFIRNKRYDYHVSMDVTYGCSHYLTVEWEREVRDYYFLCGSGIYVAGILCNGDIYSCLDIERRPELVQGNIKTDDFVDVWENRFLPFRKDRTQTCRVCRECEDREFCAADSMHTWNFDEMEPGLCMKHILEIRANEEVSDHEM